MINDGEARAARALACRGSAASHCAPQEVLAAEDDFRAARGIVLAVLLGTVIWAGIGAAAYFIPRAFSIPRPASSLVYSGHLRASARLPRINNLPARIGRCRALSPAATCDDARATPQAERARKALVSSVAGTFSRSFSLAK